VQPWTAASAEVRLYHHPSAKRPYAGLLNLLPRAIQQNAAVQFEEGLSLSEILLLPEQWPEDSTVSVS
ncbi:MAG: hypothetical protein ACRD7E_17740, partial [Bryobacteraceae bacterium]